MPGYGNYIAKMTAKLLIGDVRIRLRELAANSVHCVITSPPYLGLRDYHIPPQIWDGSPDCQHEWGNELIRQNAHHAGETNPGKEAYTKEAGAWSNLRGQFCQICGAWLGSLGLEPSVELYIQHLVGIFREVKRVLRPDGVVFLNCGDSYYSGNVKSYGTSSNQMKPLDLMGIPTRLAEALQADGWYRRSDIIWHKFCPMPESISGWRWERHRVKADDNSKEISQRYMKEAAKGMPGKKALSSLAHMVPVKWIPCPGCPQCVNNDGLILKRNAWRPTRAYDYIFMLTKTDKYFSDQEAVRESQKDISQCRSTKVQATSPDNIEDRRIGFEKYGRYAEVPGGRNPRNVQIFTSEGGFKEEHFATFPPGLPMWCIKAATSERGVCPQCRAPWARILEPSAEYAEKLTNNSTQWYSGKGKVDLHSGNSYSGITADYRILGWKATCQCNAGEPIPATVLDPFSGAGTTGIAACRLERSYIGIDISEKYTKMAKRRIEAEAPLLNKVEIC